MMESYPDVCFVASAMGAAVILAGVLTEARDCVNN